MATVGQFIQDFFIYVGWWLIPIVTIFIWKKKLEKYPIDVTIYEKRGEQLIKTNDVAGRFENPVACYRLKKSGDSIPIPQYDWVLQCMYKPTNLFEKMANLLAGKIGSITLFKYSSKQYKPVNVRIPDGRLQKVFKPIKNNKGEDVYISVYEYINPNYAMSKLEFEVIDWDDINHMTQELRAIATRRAPLLKFLEKYGGIIAIILGALTLIIAGYYYKEMIIDAGNKFVTLSKPQAAQPSQPIATQPNIPVISDVVTPGS